MITKARVQEIMTFLPEFARSPIEKMKRLPDWDWPTIFTLHISFAAAVGLLAGVFMGNPLGIVVGPFLSAISAILIGGTGAVTLAAYFNLVESRRVDLLPLYRLIAIASLPWFTMRILKFTGAPVDLVGFLPFCLLCTVGLTENFNVSKKMAIRLMGSAFGLFFLIWMTSTIVQSQKEVETQKNITPQSIEILEKELSK